MKLVKYYQLEEYKIRVGFRIMPLRTDKIQKSFQCNTEEEMNAEIKRIEEKTGGAVFIESVEDIIF
jgi:hypothetical protein